ncbi:D-tyrosyl-tRNA(Tyr) deacylase [Methanomicrobium antiquum]|uniref:D-aminoacyl-tRNA deacylase n=1 Tax=Methanomicrobium antiquum TaxID=487686 RepID=A0AAF0FL39_9EURY|nr:D-aminoacyl-tRNA deacylase [Methanomicrobium antiquum]WFN35985.1 D-tyrosyl-tRNA(Tyr) deacylase [Methanomicrobium antiquum]
MKIAIINSKTDPAGVNIREHLLSKLNLSENDSKKYTRYFSHELIFYEAEERLIYQSSIDSAFDSDLIIFISRHSSQNPVPALTVHVTGNYGTAMLGGSDKELACSSPDYMHLVLNELFKRAPDGFKSSYEVTHHGPTDLKTPSFFVEIGSTESEWMNEDVGNAVAGSILEALKKDRPKTINLVGFGGNHYAARETEIALSSKGAFGHIAHTREVSGLSREMIKQMIEKSFADGAYIDKKALQSNDVLKIEKILNELSIPLLSEGEIKDIGDLSWEKYQEIAKIALEACPFCKIRIGGMKGFGTPVLIEIMPELFEEAYKVDEKNMAKAINRICAVSFISQKGRILPIFITYEENRIQTINDLISLCVKTLHKDKDTAVIDDSLVIRKIRFDPAKAAELGVLKGPFYGKLAAGFDIVVGGRTITPAMVSKSSEKVIRIPGLENYL